MKHRFFILSTSIACLFAGDLAYAQNANSRLDRLEREIQTLSRAVYKGGQPSQSVETFSQSSPASRNFQADMEVRLNQMEGDIRRLTGMVEEQGFQIEKIMQSLNTGMAAQNTTLGTGSQNTNSASPAGPSQTLSGVEGSALELYTQAYDTVQAGQYDRAQDLFDQFLTQYPNSRLVDNATFWRAETYYAKADYQTSAKLFAEAYQSNPKGQKASDNLLKVGLSLAELGRIEDACFALDQVVSDFSGIAENVVQRAKQAQQQYRCI